MSRPAPGLACSLCSDPLELAEAVACGECGAPHHSDCWSYLGVCSVYGCGGTATGAPTLGGQDGPLILSEATVGHLPAARPALSRALARRLRAHAHALPHTVGVGATGMGAGMALLTALGWMRAGPLVYLILVGSGAAFGVLSAYLAPLQHRYPGHVSVLAAALVGACFFTLAVTPVTGVLADLVIAAGVLFTMVMATSLTDRYLGPRSALGPLLGRANGVARLLATWLAGMLPAVLFTATMNPELLFQARFLQLLGIISGTLTAASWPALERGKQIYLARLPPHRRGDTEPAALAEPGASPEA